MTGFALLTDTELRLLDLMLASGAFAETPASIRRDRTGNDTPSERRRFQPFRERLAMVEATRQRVGDSVQYGSLSELIHIRTQPSGAERGPTARR